MITNPKNVTIKKESLTVNNIHISKISHPGFEWVIINWARGSLLILVVELLVIKMV